MRNLAIKFLYQVRILVRDCEAFTRVLLHGVLKDQLITNEKNLFSPAVIKKILIATYERKQMSTKTLRKRIALVAVAALGFGVVTGVSANAAVSGAWSNTYDTTNGIGIVGGTAQLTVTSTAAATLSFVVSGVGSVITSTADGIDFTHDTVDSGLGGTPAYTLNGPVSWTDTARGGAGNDVITLTSAVAGTTTVTITYNGVKVAEKSINFRGDASKIVVESVRGAITTGAANNAAPNSDAFYVSVQDSAGNKLAVNPSKYSASGATSGALAAITGSATATSAVGVPCDATGGKGTVQLHYTRTSDGADIVGPVTNLMCSSATKYSYTASLNKTSCGPGETGTLTISAVDAAGNLKIGFTNPIIPPSLDALNDKEVAMRMN